MNATAIVIVVAILIAAALAVWVFMRERRSKRLRGRFGPEYETVVHEYGDRSKAERVLEQRSKRVERFRIRSLSESERVRFADEWRRTQSHFVDDPSGAIEDADRLVNEAMLARGYPMADFDHRAEDLSVDHPHEVNNYRQAHEIAVRHQRGQASTEDLRKAMVCYRELFDDLLEARPAGSEVRR